MRYLFALAILIGISCSKQQSKSIEPPAATPVLGENTQPATDSLFLTKPEIYTITGDFDGDGKQDTLTAFVADSTGKAVSAIIDAARSEWDSVLRYTDRHSLSAALSMNGKPTGIDTGVSFGTLGLINMGDNNGDKKDEIAYVPLLKDYSNLNSCHIWSICNGRWKELKKFGVNEGAFYESETSNEIPGYLEKHGSQWMFLDYYLLEQMPDEQYGKLQKLAVPRCE